MKQKNNRNKLLFRLAIIFALVFFTFVGYQKKVFASGFQDSPCTYTADCSAGLFCDPNSSSTCQPVVAGVDCSKDSTVCQPTKTNLTCVNGKCADAAANPSSPSSPSSPSVTASPNPGNCGTDFQSLNGVCVPKSGFGTDSLAGKSTWQDLAVAVIKILLTLAGVVAVGAIVIGGFWYITSGGNEETAEKGRKMLINAVIGLVIIILAYTLITVITNLLTKTPGA